MFQYLCSTHDVTSYIKFMIYVYFHSLHITICYITSIKASTSLYYHMFNCCLSYIRHQTNTCIYVMYWCMTLRLLIWVYCNYAVVCNLVDTISMWYDTDVQSYFNLFEIVWYSCMFVSKNDGCRPSCWIMLQYTTTHKDHQPTNVIICMCYMA